MNRFRAYLDLTLAMTIVGSSVVVGKLLIASFPVYLGTWLRFVIATPLLVAVLLWQEGRFPKISGKDWLYLFLQTLTGVFLYNICLLYGLKLTSAAEGGIITSTTPAVLGLIAFMFLRERWTWQKALGIGFTLAGILALNLLRTPTSAEQGLNPLLGNLLVFGAVIGQALFTVFRKLVSPTITPLATSTIMSLLGFVLFAPFALIEAQTFDFSRTTLSDWLTVGYFGVFVTVLAYIFWFSGVERVPISTAAVFTGVWPVSAVILSYLVLHEQIARSHVLGIVCVLVGIVFISRDSPAPLEATSPT